MVCVSSTFVLFLGVSGGCVSPAAAPKSTGASFASISFASASVFAFFGTSCSAFLRGFAFVASHSASSRFLAFALHHSSNLHSSKIRPSIKVRSSMVDLIPSCLRRASSIIDILSSSEGTIRGASGSSSSKYASLAFSRLKFAMAFPNGLNLRRWRAVFRRAVSVGIRWARVSNVFSIPSNVFIFFFVFIFI